MDVAIKRVSRGDAGLLASVAPDVFDDAIDPALLAAYLAEPGHLLVVAVSDGQVVGQACAVIHRHPDQPAELYIDNLGVTPLRRREGIAMRLLDELTAWGRSLGCDEAWVATEPDNVQARALYAGRGAGAVDVVMYEYELQAP